MIIGSAIRTRGDVDVARGRRTRRGSAARRRGRIQGREADVLAVAAAAVVVALHVPVHSHLAIRNVGAGVGFRGEREPGVAIERHHHHSARRAEVECDRRRARVCNRDHLRCVATMSWCCWGSMVHSCIGSLPCP